MHLISHARQCCLSVLTDKQITIGVVKGTILHGGVAEVHMHRETLAHLGIAGAAQSMKTLDKIDFWISPTRHIERLPSQLKYRRTDLRISSLKRHKPKGITDLVRSTFDFDFGKI